MSKKTNKTLIPNLVIVGAQKSGTTSLHKYLDNHPDIFMSKPLKEPGLFRDFETMQKILARKGYRIKSPKSLLKDFSFKKYAGEQIAGESSTYYTNGKIGYKENIAERIYAHNDQTKIIYIIRHPIERLISNYKHSITRGYLDCSLDEFIKIKKNTILTSMYYYQLQSYKKFQNNDNLLVLKFEDLTAHLNELLAQVSEFLNVDPFQSFEPKIFNKAKTQNISKDHALFSKPVFKKVMKKIYPDYQKLIENFELDISYDFNEELYTK